MTGTRLHRRVQTTFADRQRTILGPHDVSACQRHVTTLYNVGRAPPPANSKRNYKVLVTSAPLPKAHVFSSVPRDLARLATPPRANVTYLRHY